MGTRFLGEGNIGNIDSRTINNGNDTPRIVVSINVHFDNLVKNKKTDELEDQGGFWAPVEFWPQNIETAQHLIKNVFKKGMRIKVEGNLVNEKFEDKDTGDARSIMKVRTFQSGISICLQRLQSTELVPKKINTEESNNSSQEQSEANNQSEYQDDMDF
ncbi:single-stranded DNA-binding protein [Entomomonas sp. E2T0]|uniref:single-stranded DNA-binding protein n=1 Tax=Entomomonas sp. E2T0 TaxID=2930213 RepID=UPI0022284652|nr:single-stranded DNA-binding protein [Entomomonas sp. E2T0]UYZ83102.1 single-stranded DNA-binding protein [Entomomonas sp. E2T0]